MEHTLADITIPKFDLTGKTAVITGGTKGLGYATAVAFAHYGANVVVAARTQSRLDRVQKELESIGAQALAIKTDVTDIAQIENMIEKTVEKFGQLDILVANAGRADTMFATKVTEQHWDDVVDLDLKSVFFCDQAAARQMIQQGTGGRIINISSSAGVVGAKGISAYCAAKAGVVNMTRALALEFGRDNILVNAVCPGYFESSLSEEVLSNPKSRKGIEDFTIIGRVARFEEITSAIIWLACDCSGSTTGVPIIIDGGGGAD